MKTPFRGLSSLLTDALDEVNKTSSERLSDMLNVEHSLVTVPLKHAARIEAVVTPPLHITENRKALLAERFKEPEPEKSAKPRDKVTCKARPDNNKPSGSGGGKKRFVPWCK